MPAKSLVIMLALLVCLAGNAAAQDCAPPKGFVDIEHPAIVESDKLVSHTEQITVDHTLAEVVDTNAKKSLKDAIHQAGSLPGVSGTYSLGEIPFGTPGSHASSVSATGRIWRSRCWKTPAQAKPSGFATSCGITRPARQSRSSTVSVNSTIPRSAPGTHASCGLTHSSSRAMSSPATWGPWGDICFVLFFSTGSMRR